MKYSRLAKIAKKEAEKSEHRQRMGAVIFRRKQVISTAYNKPFAFSCKLHPRFTPFRTSIHAEAGAILSARTDLCGTSMLVVRINRRGEYQLAKPCPHCLAYIKYVGIRKVIFSNENGELEELYL